MPKNLDLYKSVSKVYTEDMTEEKIHRLRYELNRVLKTVDKNKDKWVEITHENYPILFFYQQRLNSTGIPTYLYIDPAGINVLRVYLEYELVL